MLGLIQRVSSASVSIEEQIYSQIHQGILLLLGVEKNDTPAQADQLLKKLLSYRIFGDDNGKMNLSLQDISGDLLIVSQFTLAADTHKGLRPSFSSAAPPEQANTLYEYFLDQAKKTHGGAIASGQFGADMQVSLCNDGPVTFLLSS
ncbi:MAG: D-aminoacyl-tRNA deacylase [Porticoccaceae bacterium]|nr:D-aminoacyl-tRNA deacylase [Porticoccaceae bacterium]